MISEQQMAARFAGRRALITGGLYAPYLRAVDNAAAILTRHNTSYRVQYQDQRYGWSFLQRCAGGAMQRRLLIRLRDYEAISDGSSPLS